MGILGDKAKPVHVPSGVARSSQCGQTVEDQFHRSTHLIADESAVLNVSGASDEMTRLEAKLVAAQLEANELRQRLATWYAKDGISFDKNLMAGQAATRQEATGNPNKTPFTGLGLSASVIAPNP